MEYVISKFSELMNSTIEMFVVRAGLFWQFFKYFLKYLSRVFAANKVIIQWWNIFDVVQLV